MPFFKVKCPCPSLQQGRIDMGYAIACGHRLTAWAAEEVLKAGGNALDAAIAGYAMSWITEPCMSGPGGGGFAVVDFDNRQLCLDFFTQTPLFKKPVAQIEYVPVEVDFGSATDTFYIGRGSVAVPGAIDGLYTLHGLGAKLPMRELLAPAIEVARVGHEIESFQHYDLYLLREILAFGQKGRELYFENGKLRPEGSTVRVPQLADFMEELSREGRRAFYEGEVGQRILSDSATNGGHLTTEDLLGYQTLVSAPRKFEGNDYTILTASSPSVGGKILINLTAAIEKHIQSGLPRHAAIANGILEITNLRSAWYSPGENIKEGGTSHMNIIDGDRNVVSLSMSIGEGSGCYVEGTDIQLNNMLGEANLQPDGLHTWKPGTRLISMMSPSICHDHRTHALISAGSGGSWRIPFMIAQVMSRLLHQAMTLEEAISAPRLVLSEGLWHAEPGHLRPESIKRANWREWKQQNLYFGGVHTAVSRKGIFIASGDGRRHGVSRSHNT